MSSTRFEEPGTFFENPIRADRLAEIRAEQRDLWDEVARDLIADDALEPEALDRAVLNAAGVAPGQRVLELACGTGTIALAAAASTGATGQVLGLDISPEMIRVARARAIESAIRHVKFRTVDEEDRLDVEEESFDSAICKHGLMWMPDPRSAVRALFRAVRPGGLIVVSSWISVERHPALSIVPKLARMYLNLPPAWPVAPPSPLDMRGCLDELLLSGRWSDVESESIVVMVAMYDSPSGLIEQTVTEDAVLEHAFARADLEARSRMRAEAIAQLGSLYPAGRIPIDVEMIVARGLKR
jgi:SAM-dependent methyltransferase